MAWGNAWTPPLPPPHTCLGPPTHLELTDLLEVADRVDDPLGDTLADLDRDGECDTTEPLAGQARHTGALRLLMRAPRGTPRYPKGVITSRSPAQWSGEGRKGAHQTTNACGYGRRAGGRGGQEGRN
jgi:hypothetical protein